MKKLIYLASVYSDADASVVARRVRQVQTATAKLIERGYLIFPSAWMEYDKSFIEKCDELWVLTAPGFEKSRGVKAEVEFAASIGKPVRFVSYPDFEPSLFTYALDGDTLNIVFDQGAHIRIGYTTPDGDVTSTIQPVDMSFQCDLGSLTPEGREFFAGTKLQEYTEDIKAARYGAGNFYSPDSNGQPPLDKAPNFDPDYLCEDMHCVSCAPYRKEQSPAKQIVLGLTGHAQVGKDTVGEYLVEKQGFVRVSFADAIRDCLYALNPIVFIKEEEPLFDDLISNHPEALAVGSDGGERVALINVQRLVDLIGWDRAKASGNVRGLLQRQGTEVGRDIISPTIWLDIAQTKIAEVYPSPVVITDVRFPNEAEFVKALGGQVVRVHRRGVGAINDHASDRELPGGLVDVEIHNDLSIADLCAQIDKKVLAYV